MTDPLDLRSTLNSLIQTCKDGQEGFLTAAQNVTDEESKKSFCEYCLQRSQFAGELQSMLHELGDRDPESASSVSGSIHRGWINLKGAILENDSHAILVECERGECCAVTEYEKALKLDLPAHVWQVISRQYAAILEAHDQVRKLSDAGAAKWV